MSQKRLKITRVGKLKIQSIEVSKPLTKTIIVGNAYGIMPYIKPLAIKLSEHNIEPYWFAFSGQENIEGEYSHEQCVQDLCNVALHVNNINRDNVDINFLSHCAGSLMTLEYLNQKNSLDIKKVIIYGLLYAMHRRRGIAERKLKLSNIKYNLSEQDWMYNPLNAIRKCTSKILFCHAKDKLNIERATESEMELAVNQKQGNKIKWFEKGYDDEVTLIDNFISTYVSFLIGRKYE